jgi:ankyrin repeat protein
VASVNDINSSPFLLAAERGDLQSLRIFLARDARINKRDFLHGTTPLMLAAQGEGGEDAEPLAGENAQRYEQTVEFLLENGADIDAVSDTGDTAIGNAVRRGNLGIVKLLLARGAKTREALPRGQRLDDLATERGHMELTRLLATHA